MSEETLSRIAEALERLAEAQEAENKFFRELHDLDEDRKEIEDKALELKGLIRSYRMMIKGEQNEQPT